MLRSSTFPLYEIGQVSKCNRMHNYQYNRITKSIYMNAIIERWILLQIIVTQWHARITVFRIESLQGGIRILQLSSSLQKKLRKQRRYTAYKPRCFCKLGEGAIDEKVAGRILFSIRRSRGGKVERVHSVTRIHRKKGERKTVRCTGRAHGRGFVSQVI